MNLKCNKLSHPIVLSMAVFTLAGSAHAGFQYNPRDLVFGFRTDGGGTPEVTINAGQVSTYYNLPVGQTITISNISATFLLYAFPDLNNLLWSCAADVRTTGDSSYPFNTIWVTSPRSDLSTQTDPWQRKSQSTQGNAAAKLDGVPGNADVGAVSYGNVVSAGLQNTATAIVIPEGLSPYAYSIYVGANGNYVNTFQGNVETATGPTFTTDGLAVRADLYQLIPSSAGGNGTYLGYFEFNPNGVMTYHSGPSQSAAPPQPRITSATRAGANTMISFTTVSSAQYSLRYTNNAGLKSPVSTWPTSGSPVTGTGATMTITDTTGDAQRYYRISAHY